MSDEEQAVEEEPLKDLCFVDTETTGLNPDEHHIWEVAIIRCKQDTLEEVNRVIIQIDQSFALGSPDPFALNIGHFHERYGKAGPAPHWLVDDDGMNGRTFRLRMFHADLSSDQYRLNTGARAWMAGYLFSPEEAAAIIERFTRDSVLVGNTVEFDSERMGNLLREHGYAPKWHYQTTDIETRVAGYMEAVGASVSWPVNSKKISKFLEVDEPEPKDRHTAYGDAHWVYRQWKALNEMKVRQIAEHSAEFTPDDGAGLYITGPVLAGDLYPKVEEDSQGE